MNKMDLTWELMLLVKLVTERLSSRMNLRITVRKAGRESKNSRVTFDFAQLYDIVDFYTICEIF